jgi:serine/threonine protein kinase
VVVAAKEKQGGVKVAVKKIKDAVEDKEQGKLLLRELKLLRHFRGHENVVGIKDIIESPSGQSRFKDIYIVTDLMDTDLNRIIRSTQELSDDHVRYFTYQVRCPLRPKILDSDRRSAEHDGVRARPQPL